MGPLRWLRWRWRLRAVDFALASDAIFKAIETGLLFSRGDAKILVPGDKILVPKDLDERLQPFMQRPSVKTAAPLLEEHPLLGVFFFDPGMLSLLERVPRMKAGGSGFVKEASKVDLPSTKT